MIKELHIQGYRGIQELKISDFKKVNLLVGKNNSGKTTVLENLFLITGPANPALLMRVNIHRKISYTDDVWTYFFNEFKTDAGISIQGELIMDGKSEKRELLITPKRTDSSVTVLPKSKDREKFEDQLLELVKKGGAIKGITMSYTRQTAGRTESYLSQLIDEDEELKFGTPTNYTETVKCAILATDLVGDFSGPFEDIQKNKKVNLLVDVLRNIEPRLNMITLGKDGIYCDIGLDQLVPIDLMGDGFIRLMGIVTMMYHVRDGILLIDEIDNGLHYTSLEILWRAVFIAATEFNVQVFATTHSVECVKVFGSSTHPLVQEDNIRLYRIEKKETNHKAVRYESDILAASLDSDWEVR